MRAAASGPQHGPPGDKFEINRHGGHGVGGTRLRWKLAIQYVSVILGLLVKSD